jgi:hypothetical protein
LEKNIEYLKQKKGYYFNSEFPFNIITNPNLMMMTPQGLQVQQMANMFAQMMNGSINPFSMAMEQQNSGTYINMPVRVNGRDYDYEMETRLKKDMNPLFNKLRGLEPKDITKKLKSDKYSIEDEIGLMKLMKYKCFSDETSRRKTIYQYNNMRVDFTPYVIKTSKVTGKPYRSIGSKDELAALIGDSFNYLRVKQKYPYDEAGEQEFIIMNRGKNRNQYPIQTTAVVGQMDE